MFVKHAHEAIAKTMVLKELVKQVDKNQKNNQILAGGCNKSTSTNYVLFTYKNSYVLCMNLGKQS